MQLEAMAKKQNETSSKLAATAAELKEAKARLADATSNLDAASLNFAARLDALEARSGGTFALDASTGSGCAGSQCTCSCSLGRARIAFCPLREKTGGREGE